MNGMEREKDLKETVDFLTGRYVQQREQRAGRGNQRRRKLRRIALFTVLGSVVAGVAFWYLNAARKERPYVSVVERFIRAIEQRDAEALCQVVSHKDPDGIYELHLEPWRVQRALDLTLGDLPSIRALRITKAMGYSPRGEGYDVWWGDANGQPLRDYKGEELNSRVFVERTPEGLRVAFPISFITLCESRLGKRERQITEGLGLIRQVRSPLEVRQRE